MKKKLLSLFAGTALLVPTIGFAVGLGSVRTYSHLNEKLKAEIPVLSVKRKGRMTVSLASNAEFAKRGVQRSDALNNLNFTLVERKGRFYIDVSSKKQIAVPYLNFILRLTTPDGVVSREYAIFLDPVSNTPRKQAAVKKKITNSPYRSPRKKASSSNVKSRAAVSVSSAGAGQYGPIRKGETLWSIATHTRPSSAVPVRDMLNAIKRANPRTLSKGLPAGVTIVIPTIDGYSAYSGGYAPMPEVIKKPKAKQTKKKVVKQSTKATVKKSTSESEQKFYDSRNDQVTATTTEKNSSLPSKVTKSNTPKEEIDQAKKTEVETNEALISGLVKDSDSKEEVSPELSLEVKKKATKSQSFLNKGSLDDEVQPQQLQDDSQKVTDFTRSEAIANNTDDSAKNVIETTGNELGSVEDEIKESVKESVDETTFLASEANKKVIDLVKESEVALPSSGEKVKGSATTEKATNEISQPSIDAKPKISAVASDTSSSSESSDMLSKVTDSVPYIGGGLAIAGLGLFLLNRRRKSKNELAPLTDSDMAELMGEDDLDVLKTVEDELESPADQTDENLSKEALILNDEQSCMSENIDEIDDVSNITTLSDDVFSEIDNIVEDSDSSEDGLVAAFEDLNNDLSLEDNAFIDFDEESEKSALTVDVANENLSDSVDCEIDGALTASDSDTEVIVSAVENEEKNIDVNITELTDIDEFDFDLDSEQEKSLFEPIDLEGTTDTDIELSEEFDFDLTEGDDIDELLRTDEDSLDKHNEEELLFNLIDTDSIAEEVSDAKEIVAEKIESTSFALVDDLEPQNAEAEKDDLSVMSDEDSNNVTKELNANVESVSDTEAESVDSKDSRIRMKMDLVNAFISIGEDERAKELLYEIIEGGNDEQVGKAKELLANLG